ncbi:MAG: DNA gyrase/topoisomerase IV subunit A [Saprospiraceae bacterium]|nr:DNA gyrase/topoisomerase IV subunit A [Saprospiraceae bacterium]MBK9043644.1 DNA gyrase/topoisomerase IV subunit A [Saprospiraceae bacterium]
MSDEFPKGAPASDSGNGDLVTLSHMYKEYFLDYASYVILERAVPDIDDGLKPVQRRILHAMKEMDDGRFHKVANIIGQTMQYHPHGDAAIGDALVNLGQKDLLIDCQGNWGDVRTGDSAAAPRYIEARLTKFALEVLFNPQTTEWQLSYDGRKKEPVSLPVKFPLVLSQGVEGIAVGLSTKILPHNFIELIKASIKILEGKKVKIYPDFQTGGMVDVKEYNDGKRGGRVKVRAKIKIVDKSNISIVDLPFGVTTNTMIESILKANDKGQIKLKKVIDNTAKDVEILLELMPGVSPDVTMDALYAFTDCEVSYSPNACVIVDNKPLFLDVIEILEISTRQTKELLRRELEIKKSELEEKWHMASLEKIFIENRIYHDIEECETWEDVLTTIDRGLKKYVATPGDPLTKGDSRILLMRDITQDDVIRLTEIKIKRISKYNSFKADEYMANLLSELEQVKHDLLHLTEFAIAYFENLLTKYGKGRERRTLITDFESIEIKEVVANNAKLYVDRKEGFIGMGMKKDEFVCDCSDIADIIAFTRDGKFKVVKIADKVFVGKDIIHVDVWLKSDDRTTYNMVYLDGSSGKAMAKRFNVTAITRDKEYDLSMGTKGSKVLYFTFNPNGESEVINIQLSPGSSAKKKIFEFDFADLAIKGRSSQGNVVTKYPVKKITQISVGKSSLGAMKIWLDEVSGKLNQDERGKYLGAFDTGCKLVVLYKDASYEVIDLDLTKKFDVNNIVEIGKFEDDTVINVIYHEGEKGWTMVKRFKIETTTQDQKFVFLPDSQGTKLYLATMDKKPVVTCFYKSGNQTVEKEVVVAEFIEVKGWKALGNKLHEGKLTKVVKVSPVAEENEDAAEISIGITPSEEQPVPKIDFPVKQGKLFEDNEDEGPKDNPKKDDRFQTGDTIEFDV